MGKEFVPSPSLPWKSSPVLEVDVGGVTSPGSMRDVLFFSLVVEGDMSRAQRHGKEPSPSDPGHVTLTVEITFGQLENKRMRVWALLAYSRALLGRPGDSWDAFGALRPSKMGPLWHEKRPPSFV